MERTIADIFNEIDKPIETIEIKEHYRDNVRCSSGKDIKILKDKLFPEACEFEMTIKVNAAPENLKKPRDVWIMKISNYSKERFQTKIEILKDKTIYFKLSISVICVYFSIIESHIKEINKIIDDEELFTQAFIKYKETNNEEIDALIKLLEICSEKEVGEKIYENIDSFRKFCIISINLYKAYNEVEGQAFISRIANITGFTTYKQSKNKEICNYKGIRCLGTYCIKNYH